MRNERSMPHRREEMVSCVGHPRQTRDRPGISVDDDTEIAGMETGEAMKSLARMWRQPLPYIRRFPVGRTPVWKAIHPAGSRIVRVDEGL